MTIKRPGEDTVTYLSDTRHSQNDKILQGVEALVKKLDGMKAPFDPKDLFDGTPERVIRHLTTFAWSWDEVRESLVDILTSAVFETKSISTPVYTTPFTAVSMCPHHLLPVQYKIVAGYLPANQVLGVSKIVRASRLLARRPVLQEDLTYTIACFLHDCDNSAFFSGQRRMIPALESFGSAVLVKGMHTCMSCRGVEADGSIVTMHVRGEMEDAKFNGAAMVQSLLAHG